MNSSEEYVCVGENTFLVTNFFCLMTLWTQVLYMSFDRFLLAVESRDLSQADKSIIRVSPFPTLSDG